MVAGTAIGTSQAVDLNGDIGDAQDGEEVVEGGDDVRVQRGIVASKGLHVNLVELAVTTFLRAFIPEHGTPKVEFLNPPGGVKVMLNVSTDDGGGGLGPQGQGLTALVREGVHLLFHDVRGFSDTPLKQAGFFQNGNENFPEPVASQDTVHCVSHIFPEDGIPGEDVIHAANRAYLHDFFSFRREVIAYLVAL